MISPIIELTSSDVPHRPFGMSTNLPSPSQRLPCQARLRRLPGHHIPTGTRIIAKRSCHHPLPSTVTAAGSGDSSQSSSRGPQPPTKEDILARIKKAQEYVANTDASQLKFERSSSSSSSSSTNTSTGTASQAAVLPASPSTSTPASPSQSPAPPVSNSSRSEQSNSRQGISIDPYPETPPVQSASSDKPTPVLPSPTNNGSEGSSSTFNAQSSSSTDTGTLLSSSPRRAGSGSATEAADFLRTALTNETNALNEGLSSDMRMEEYTQKKMENMKKMGANIITVDQSYNPFNTAGGGVGSPKTAMSPEEAAAAASSGAPVEGAYQPKVSTWGVFPRPSSISEAYGGGRNIKPGQELETKEEREKREANFRAALVAYKVKAGTEIDPSLEAEAMVLYTEGNDLMAKGMLRPAFTKLDQAAQLVPIKTKVGGLATLGKAVCLDSMGESELAKKLYKSLQGHPIPSVSKKARQMVQSFDAAVFLKANSMRMGIKNTEYAGYFRRLADRNRVYLGSEEDRLSDEYMAKMATAVAIGVLVAPLLLIGAITLARGA